MENKERALLDKLRITFKSVQDQENQVRKLERNGRRNPLKNPKSIVAKYIASPVATDLNTISEAPSQAAGLGNMAKSQVSLRKGKLIGAGDKLKNPDRAEHETAETGQQVK